MITITLNHDEALDILDSIKDSEIENVNHVYVRIAKELIRSQEIKKVK